MPQVSIDLTLLERSRPTVKKKVVQIPNLGKRNAPQCSGDSGRFVNQNKIYSPVHMHSMLDNVISVPRESYAGGRSHSYAISEKYWIRVINIYTAL